LELGKEDLAMADLLDLFAAHHALGSESALIPALVRRALFEIANGVIATGLQKHRWTEPQLAALESVLAQFDSLADFHRALSAERASSNQAIDWAFGHYRPSGVSPPKSQNPSFRTKNVNNKLFSGWGRWNQTFLNQVFDDYLARLDVDAGRWHGNFKVEHDCDKLEGLERRMLSLAEGLLLQPFGFEFFIEKALWGHTQHQLLRVAIALERHRLANGALPEKLDDLIPGYLPAVPHDVFTGAPLFYRPNADGTFRIYGTGLNRWDDNGEANNMLEPVRSRDWAWPMSKTE
jgi:hypothetical protein